MTRNTAIWPRGRGVLRAVVAATAAAGDGSRKELLDPVGEQLGQGTSGNMPAQAGGV
jgi:hypothetical protein